MAIRILHIVGIMNMGGLENLIMNIYRNIDRDKIQFDFLVTREEIGIFDQEIKSLGGKIYNIPSMESVGIIKYKKNLRRFFREHQEYRIVHCHRDALCSVYLKEAKKANIPVRIAHSHNIRLAETKNIKGLVKSLLKNYFMLYTNNVASHRFACSNLAGKWLYGDNEFKIIPNAIDTRKYNYNEEIALSLREELNISEETFVIGHVGRFDIQKNHKFLVDIFKEFEKQHSDCLLCLVGDGSLSDEIKSYVKNNNLQDKVRFLGIREDVNKLMMMFDVFLFPSLFEGLGIVLVEAQSTGLSCLISDQIPQESDMRLGLTQYLTLDNQNVWLENLKTISEKQKDLRINRKSNLNKIKERGYDILSLTTQIQSFYQEEYIKCRK